VARALEARGTNDTDLAGGARPFYQLMMFPYPSAEGLHVGNLYAFTGNDIHGRFQRLRGHTVFEPIGFDAFGIHSENYALKVGAHPMELIPRNVANFRRQLERTGLMVDWSHAVDTTTPEYYRWTQWVFLRLLERGLAYKKQAAVNWCPFDKTVLANEQVVGGRVRAVRHRGGAAAAGAVVLPHLEYAPRLLANLDTLDWSETTKTAQRNWIGKSDGAELDFTVATSDAGGDEGRGEPRVAPRPSPVVRVFTTRPDTLYGATYLVLAPEHPLVDAVTTPARRADRGRLPGRDRAAGRGGAQGHAREDGGVHRLVRAQPGDRRADPRVDRRLRAHGVRHGRDHGGARARRARLRVRAQVRAADRTRRRGRGRGRHHAARGPRTRRTRGGRVVNSGPFDGRRPAEASGGSSRCSPSAARGARW
jgi:hypothetical protein